VIGRGLVQPQPQETADRERIGRAPGDAAFRIEALEVADQQQPEVAPRRQARPTHDRGVEALALAPAAELKLAFWTESDRLESRRETGSLLRKSRPPGHDIDHVTMDHVTNEPPRRAGGDKHTPQAKVDIARREQQIVGHPTSIIMNWGEECDDDLF
jgi:hypothetical protein